MLTRRKKIIFSAIAALIPLGLLIIGVEISLRLKKASAKSTEARRTLDPKLGWAPTPNLVREGRSMDAIMRQTSFKMTQDSHGFRRWGDLQSAKKRVLVLGDSYTQSDDIDDAKTYFAELARQIPNAEFWAYGCSGFGTFQQALVLEQVVGEIKPDLLLLQMSSNDVVNNLLELEDAMPFLSTPAARPYLMDDGQVLYHYATRNKGLKAWSLAFRSLSERFDQLFHKSENWIPGQVRNYGTHRAPANIDELMAKTTVKTASLLVRMKQTLGPNAQMIAFYDEDVPPLTNALKQACVSAGVPVIDSIGKSMMAEEGRRKAYVYRTRDLWHWNDDGHKLVAELLKHDIKKRLETNPDDSAQPARPEEKIARDPARSEPPPK